MSITRRAVLASSSLLAVTGSGDILPYRPRREFRSDRHPPRRAQPRPSPTPACPRLQSGSPGEPIDEGPQRRLQLIVGKVGRVEQVGEDAQFQKRRLEQVPMLTNDQLAQTSAPSLGRAFVGFISSTAALASVMVLIAAI